MLSVVRGLISSLIVLLAIGGALIAEPAAAQSADVPDRGERGVDVALDPEEAELLPESTPNPVVEREDAGDDEYDDEYEDEYSDEPEAQKAQGHKGIEEIQVTATKRQQSIQEVPISMTALSGAMLDETGLTEFSQLQNFVPNLKISPATDTRSTSIRIRGIGSPGSNAGIDPSVGIFIDGVYQGRAGMSVGDLIDIERVEVLRGPQGTLWGKNTAAGAIAVVTKRPSYEREVNVETIVGNYNNVQLRGSANTPLLEDHLALRLSGFRVVRDGYDINEYDDEHVNNADKWGLRGKLAWDINDRLSIQFSGDYSLEESETFVAEIIRYDGPSSLFFGFAGMSTATGIPIPHADPFDRIVGANEDPENKVTVGGAAIDMNLDWLDHQFRWLNAWRTYSSDSLFDGDFSIYNAVTSSTDVDLDQFSSELIMTSPGDGIIEYQAGLYFYYSKMHTVDSLRTNADWAATIPQPPLRPLFNGQTNVNDNTHETLSAAMYGEATYAFTDYLKFTGGLRLNYEQKRRDGSSLSSPINTLPLGPLGGPDDYRDQERAVTNLQWRAVFRYFALEQINIPEADNFMVYTSVANGFKSGGFNQLRVDETTGASSEFSDEESINVELGIKSNWFDNSVIFNFTGYFTDFNDFQAQVLTGSVIEVANAGRLYSYGFETDFVYLTPIEDLMVGTSAAFLISRYKNFENAPNSLPNMQDIADAMFGGNMTLCLSNPVCNQDLSGEIRDNAPKWTVSTFASYERPVPNLPLAWFTRADYSFTSFQYLDVDLDPNLAQPNYHLLNLRTGLRSDEGLWELTLWVNNVTNTNYLIAGFDVPTLSGYAAVTGPPRTFGVTLNVEF